MPPRSQSASHCSITRTHLGGRVACLPRARRAPRRATDIDDHRLLVGLAREEERRAGLDDPDRTKDVRVKHRFDRIDVDVEGGMPGPRRRLLSKRGLTFRARPTHIVDEHIQPSSGVLR